MEVRQLIQNEAKDQEKRFQMLREKNEKTKQQIKERDEKI